MKFLRNDPTLKQHRRELRRNQTEAEKDPLGTLAKQVTPPSLPLNKGRDGGVIKYFSPVQHRSLYFRLLLSDREARSRIRRRTAQPVRE